MKILLFMQLTGDNQSPLFSMFSGSRLESIRPITSNNAVWSYVKI